MMDSQWHARWAPQNPPKIVLNKPARKNADIKKEVGKKDKSNLLLDVWELYVQ